VILVTFGGWLDESTDFTDWPSSMSTELWLSAFSLVVTTLLGLLVWHNSRGANKNAEKKVSVEEQAAEDARDDVIAERRRVELERLYGRLDKIETDFEAQGLELKGLTDHLRDCDKREILLYHHVSDLRNHIVNNKPPPPPRMPLELVEWFEKFGETEPVH
jgi:hypothetical protein